MLVKELIAKLQELPQELRVLMPGDDCYDYRGATDAKVEVIQKRKPNSNFDTVKVRKQAVVVLV